MELLYVTIKDFTWLLPKTNPFLALKDTRNINISMWYFVLYVRPL